MIPVELRLTNFMSYKQMDEPLNFSSIHTAVLCGPNGHGKSSLLDAITWVLWGQARGVDRRGAGTDDLIHHKEPHMQVEFTFELEEQHYRVIRARSRKNKAGQSRLEFQILDNGSPRSLTGETINATQEIINKTLRMDYETFVNSAFVMQGRADNFMTKSANERKEILSEILGLSIYDELEELAREKRKELNELVRVTDAKITGINQELEQLPAYKEEAQQATEELAKIRAAIEEAESELAGLRDKKAVLDVKAARLSDISARAAQARSDISIIDNQLTSLEDSISQAQELVDREEEINARYGELGMLRGKDEALLKKGQKYTQLEGEVNKTKLKIAQAKSALESDVEHLSKRKAELESELSRRQSIEAALLQTEARLAELKPIARQVEELRKRYGELREKKASLAASIKADEARLVSEEKRRSLLSDGDSCPLCKKPLESHEKHSINSDIESEIGELKGRISSRHAERDSIARELISLEAAGKDLSEKLKGEGAIQAEKGKLETQIGALKNSEEALSAINRQLSEMNLKLMQDAFAPEEQSELKRLSDETHKLEYSAGEHQKIRDRLKELVIYDKLKANLENAKQTIQAAKETTEALSAQREAKLRMVSDDEVVARELKSELSTLEELSVALKRGEAGLLEKKKGEADAISRKSTAQVKLDTCKRLAEQKEELNRDRRALAQEVGIYDTLTTIFSKKGIQALIIENTVPEIENEANALLHRLTNGQMSLRFVTQKDQKTGGVIETLDLIITDGELGERKYELFSGGEAFRINFAVRIALSKLLARRAGARLETLVIDEGFGTQDEDGKEKLIEAIIEVQNDFKKIIVITHLEDLKELFPARIEVTKKRGVGSVVTVI